MKNEANDWACVPPSYRPDIEREIDIIEEIARMVGYDAIPSDQRLTGLFQYNESDPESKLDPIRSTFQGFGFHQIYSNSLQNETDANSIGKNAVQMMNPLSQEMAYLRTSLLPGLLRSADFNVKNGTKDLRLFELANVHEQKGDGLEGIGESQHCAGILYGESNKESVHGDAKKEDIFELKGILSSLFEHKYNMRLDLKNESHDNFDLSHAILINRQPVGFMGRIHPSWLDKMGLDLDNVFAFEINLSPILKMMGSRRSFKKIITFPKIERDINLVMATSTQIGPIADMMLKKGGKLVINANPINIYYDEKALGKDLKSVTFNLEFQDHTKTLEDKDVTPVINEIIRIAEKKFNAKLRS